MQFIDVVSYVVKRYIAPIPPAHASIYDKGQAQLVSVKG